MIASELGLGLIELRLIFRQLAFRFFEQHLEGTRIDLCDDVSLVDELPFLERQLEQLTVDSRPDGHGVKRGDRSQRTQSNRQVLPHDRRHADRDREIGRLTSRRRRPTPGARVRCTTAAATAAARTTNVTRHQRMTPPARISATRSGLLGAVGMRASVSVSITLSSCHRQPVTEMVVSRNLVEGGSITFAAAIAACEAGRSAQARPLQSLRAASGDCRPGFKARPRALVAVQRRGISRA